MKLISALAKPRNRQSGSFIIEAIISLLLFAVALIGLLGLAAQGINQVGQSKSRSDAAFLVGELFADMWVASTVNLGTIAPDTAGPWETKLTAAIPEANARIFFANCDCVLTPIATATTGSNACPTDQQKLYVGTSVPVAQKARGGAAVAIPASQAVTVCVTWTDRRDPSAPRLYQASTMISRN